MTTITDNMSLILLLTDIVGTIAFAVSGAVVAIRKEMDVFGVNILAVVTATGGGVLRDLMLGKAPPSCFRDRRDIYITILTADIVFLFLFFNRKKSKEVLKQIYNFLYFLFDTLGLAAFTVNGVAIGFNYPIFYSTFLIVFMGMITGVGGGIIRDILAMEMPAIFVRHIYACASLIGAITTTILWVHTTPNTGMLVGFLVVILIRCLAKHYDWNLPRITSARNRNI